MIWEVSHFKSMSSNQRTFFISPNSWSRGKRGALRVGYVYFAEYGHVLLIVVYSKNEDVEISGKGKNVIKRLIAEEKALFSKGYYT